MSAGIVRTSGCLTIRPASLTFLTVWIGAPKRASRRAEVCCRTVGSVYALMWTCCWIVAVLPIPIAFALACFATRGSVPACR